MVSTIRRKLTPKQIKFISKVISTGSPVQAARESCDVSTDNSARNAAWRMLHNPNVCSRIEHLCEKRGLTEDWAIRILKKQGRAVKPVIIGKEAVDYPDNPARLTAAQTALKLHGHLKTGVDIVDNSQRLSIGISSPADLAQLKGIVADLKALRSSPRRGQTGEIVDVDSYRVD